MKRLLSYIINILIIFNFILIVFFDQSVFRDIIIFLFISLSAVSFLSLILFGFNNRKVLTLFIFSLCFTFLFSYQKVSVDSKYFTASKSLNSGIYLQDNMLSTKNENIENMLQNLEIKLKASSSRQDISDYLKYMQKVVSANLSTTSPKTFLDYARVEEAVFTLGFSSSTDQVLNDYVAYCKLDPNNPECYASIARFLITNKDNKKEALKYANKALELATSQEEIVKYNGLIEYISNLK